MLIEYRKWSVNKKAGKKLQIVLFKDVNVGLWWHMCVHCMQCMSCESEIKKNGNWTEWAL